VLIGGGTHQNFTEAVQLDLEGKILQEGIAYDSDLVVALMPIPSLNAVNIVMIGKTGFFNPSGTICLVSEKQESQSLHS